MDGSTGVMFGERPAVCAKSLLVLSLMQAFPIFTKYVNHWVSNLIYSGTVIGTKCHFWQPSQVTSFLLL